MVNWKKARKKPVVIEFREVEAAYEVICTLEGKLIAKRNRDFVIRGVDGELYPIRKEIFAKTYEVID